MLSQMTEEDRDKGNLPLFSQFSDCVPSPIASHSFFFLLSVEKKRQGDRLRKNSMFLMAFMDS